jgi:hypothetical protein
MRIEKRTMNWLPEKPLHKANEDARAKRRAYVKYDMRLAANLAANLANGRTLASSDQVTLAIKVAAERIQTQADTKRKAAAEKLSSAKFA